MSKVELASVVAKPGTVLLLLLGAAISVVVHLVTTNLLPRNYYVHEDYLIVISYLEIVGVFPTMSVLVGAIDGVLLPRSYAWLSGTCLFPLFVYILQNYVEWDGIALILFIIYILLCSGFAYLVSRRKHASPAAGLTSGCSGALAADVERT